MLMRRGVIFVLYILLAVNVFGQYKSAEKLTTPDVTKTLDLEGYKAKLNSFPEEAVGGYLGQFIVPGNDGYIISRFGPRSGRMHYGTDIKMFKGDTVVATQSGVIARSNWGYGFGNLIVVQHRNNIQTYYAHLSKFLKRKGETVEKGEPIGLAGSTGRARGPHLHFEMRENGKPFDPELVFDFKDEKIRDDAAEMESLIALHKRLKPKGYSTNVAVPEYYKVRSGDSLWVISRKFKTPIGELCRLNNISENSVLQIGQPLKMY
ncbi:peptidoglycan DD-metalloendopeptidase family protein [Draconibacterium sp. IB214405]|uniref:peptidoglycan DD-metalloendopeptidase family protein n=1 Tax=Draconibacterium sp. IB214405 TaxID=3097352 RepID=UPI002A153676|nr:peptidoglycan DD-metalloendopeptidase family protein [Draconibacterium sp. IB214405]MDX8341408.1 peptidoglycan DD-metalloendopeptidase family protein [Draconibacterium sp. IB214405]